MRLYRWTLPAAALCGLGLVIALHPLFASGFDLIPGYPIDTRLVHWILEWGYRSLLLGQASFWDPPFFFPVKNTGAFSETLLGSAPLYWLPRAVGLTPHAAFVVWLIAILIANYWIVYAWLREAGPFSSGASALGAYVFAFSNMRLVQIYHPQLLPQFFSVGALICLARAIDAHERQQARRSRVWVVAFFGALAAQVFASFYLGWFLVLGLAITGLTATALPSSRRVLLSFVAARWRAIAAAALLAGAALAPMLLRYSSAQGAVGARAFGDLATFLPRISSWFFMGGGSWAYSWLGHFRPWQHIEASQEHCLALGFLTGGLAAIGLWRQRARPLVRVLSLSAVGVVLLATTWPGGFTAWRLVFWLVPGARAIRAVGRISLLLLIPAAFGVAACLDACRARGLALVLAMLVAAEQGRSLHFYSAARTDAHVARLASRLDPSRCGYFYFSPDEPHSRRYPDDFVSCIRQVDAMWAALGSGIPTINGYSGNFPPEWDDLLHDVIHGPDDRRRLASDLSRWIESHSLDPHRFCWIAPSRKD
jgi:hypothetical protein